MVMENFNLKLTYSAMKLTCVEDGKE